MGKTTFHRVVSVLHRHYVVASLPCVGGALFLIGSFFFAPGAGERAQDAGASAFLVGSICYWAAPIMDYQEFTYNRENLVEGFVDKNVVVSPGDIYEALYKDHLLRMQRANALIYMIGGIFFIGGSVLFYPALDDIIVHGGWLYITGCCMTLLGAILAGVTAHELRKTAVPLVFQTSKPSLLALPWWSDEGATIVSCGFYVLGNLAFIVGSVFFFPRILEYGGQPIRVLALVLFIMGSLCFLAGAIIDLLVLHRSGQMTQDHAAERRTDATSSLNAFIWRSLSGHPVSVQLTEMSSQTASAIRNSLSGKSPQVDESESVTHTAPAAMPADEAAVEGAHDPSMVGSSSSSSSSGGGSSSTSSGGGGGSSSSSSSSSSGGGGGEHKGSASSSNSSSSSSGGMVRGMDGKINHAKGGPPPPPASSASLGLMAHDAAAERHVEMTERV